MSPSSKLLTEPYFNYIDFLQSCKTKGYGSSVVLHKHHIIPKCLGGSNNKDNLVKLSVEDHITAHLMMARCFDDNSKERLSNLRSARLLNKKSIKDTDILLEISKSFLGENNPFYNKRHSKETKMKLSEATKQKLTGVSYEIRYGFDARHQKQIRSEANKIVWNSRTLDERNSITEKISAKLEGRDAWNLGIGKQVSVEGIKFSSIKSAAEYFNTSKYLLLKSYEVIFLKEI